MIRYLCNTDDPIVRSLLERVNFLFFPMANPDGVYDGDSKKAKDYPNFIIDALDQIQYNGSGVRFFFDVTSSPF